MGRAIDQYIGNKQLAGLAQMAVLLLIVYISDQALQALSAWTMAGVSQRALKDLLKVQQGAGLNIRWLDRDELIERVPAIARDGLRGGTFSPEDGSASPMMSSAAFYRRAGFQPRGSVFEEAGIAHQEMVLPLQPL